MHTYRKTSLIYMPHIEITDYNGLSHQQAEDRVSKRNKQLNNLWPVIYKTVCINLYLKLSPK